MEAVHPNPSGHDNAPAGHAETLQPTADSIISAYLSEHIPEHRELVDLRIEGWNNPAADTHFENERSSADNPSEKQKDAFYEMTCRIGDELNAFLGGPSNGILSLPFPPRKSISVLDLCMAPGGFSTAVLNHNPHHDVSIHGVTLPISMGGYEVRIPNWRSDPRIANIQFLDVTMLASEMGITSPDEIPSSHPDKSAFITTPLFPESHSDPDHSGSKIFDIIFCGGTVVRNHSQTFQSYRKYGRQSEGTRLLTTQLVIGMKHIRKGGTMVVVLHRADTWLNVALFHRFSKFSDVSKMRLFKPKKAHARKGSFYLVVRGVNPDCEAAKEAVEFWMGEWKVVSLLTGTDLSFETDGGRSGDGDEEATDDVRKRLEDVEAAKVVLAGFGERLVQLTRPVFKIQLEALRKAPWAGATNRAGWRTN